MALEAVITGMGAVSASGLGAETLNDAIAAGVPLFRPIDLFDPAPYVCRKAALVPRRFFPPESGKSRGRGWRLMSAAALEALESAGVGREEFGGPRCKVVLGTTLGGMDILKDLVEGGPDMRAAFVLPYNAAADALADMLGAGDAVTVSGACASSLMAIGLAAAMVSSGECDAVLAGGFDPFCEFVHAGFSSLMALDPDALRPFDSRRKGLILGEGAAAVLVESEGSARDAGRRPIGAVRGFATSSDANHITGPHPDGEGLLRAMTEAWSESGLDPGRLGLVHAHGTGTVYNDRMEGIAISRFFGETGAAAPVTGSKGVTGHTLGAAGAMEVVSCLCMMRDSIVHPAAGFSAADQECVISPVTTRIRSEVRSVLKTAAGFGGQNAALVLERLER